MCVVLRIETLGAILSVHCATLIRPWCAQVCNQCCCLCWYLQFDQLSLMHIIRSGRETYLRACRREKPSTSPRAHTERGVCHTVIQHSTVVDVLFSGWRTGQISSNDHIGVRDTSASVMGMRGSQPRQRVKLSRLSPLNGRLTMASARLPLHRRHRD